MSSDAGSVKDPAGSVGTDGADDRVAYSTYKQLLDQRKADQARATAIQAELDRLKSDAESAEAVRLTEQNRFKELYESEKAKREASEGQVKETNAKIAAQRKRDALKAELGGVRKDEYLSFADLASIQLQDDGSVDSDSVKQAANKFREAHPELITPKPGSKLPNDAAAGYTPPAGKPLDKMTPEELRALYVAHNTKK